MEVARLAQQLAAQVHHRLDVLITDLGRLGDAPIKGFIVVADELHVHAQLNGHRCFSPYPGKRTNKKPASGRLFGGDALVGIGDELAHESQAALDHRAALPFALDAHHAVIFNFNQDVKTLLDVVDVDAFADHGVADGNAGQLAAQQAANDWLTSLTWTWLTLCLNCCRNATGSCPAIKVLPVSIFMRR